ncbi:MAG: hypothetical protein K1X72_20360 [Pyrinomonadaceae bacterium]|nr:hypothetical protein [Pyrinomonadaceae bacterium]
MKTLQIIFLISFAVLVLVIPFLVFNFIQGNGTNTTLIIFVAVIFIVNGFFIVRKLLNLKKDKQN